MKPANLPVFFYALLLTTACTDSPSSQEENSTREDIGVVVDSLKLPKPYQTKSSKNFSKVVGWQEGETPVAPAEFVVTKFADNLKSARWIYVLPNGDVLVSQANTDPSITKKIGMEIIGAGHSEHVGNSPNCITLLRDTNKDGTPDLRETFLSDLNQPFGMLLIGNDFYVAVTDGLWKYSYKTGDTKIKGEGKKILDLPAGGYNNHWTRNIITNKNQSKIYISVGSGSNVAEHGMDNEVRRANILEINPDGSGERVYASGLRNPVGMDWATGTNTLWTAVNERDELGDDLVPDYLTSVKEGGFYGWPYSYWGQNLDPRIADKDKRPDLIAKAITPDVSLGSHTASLGLAFYNGKKFPARYQGGAFIGQHGSWNRKDIVGYKVVFVPFKNGKPSGPPEDFLTGFIADASDSKVHGRPVGVKMLPDGSLLVADDAADMVWRVAVK
ncbi:MAG TPA: sorbosone dehydrogenase family protein [Cytophagaceae bacterium]|jgi:glucose/arabinose dehydrogenase|nr:sorbosone dehydrogenase family protein [Cytophagaceae bacterium]